MTLLRFNHNAQLPPGMPFFTSRGRFRVLTAKVCLEGGSVTGRQWYLPFSENWPR
jgi:hypothetical protein